MKRSKHSLSHYKLQTFDMGELIPVGCFEALPGDTIQQASAALLRVSPLLAPVMHPVSVRIHHWFVPYRLIWTDWEKFITGGSDGLGEGATVPVIDVPGGGFAKGSLADYLGVPTGSAATTFISVLPFRAYALIFNEFYRDEDLVSPLALSKASGDDNTTSVALQKCAWEKDYVTSSRAWPQKGPDVTLPLGTTAPVVYSHANTNVWLAKNAATGATFTPGVADGVEVDTSGGVTNSDQTIGLQFDPRGNLLADLANATAVNVNDVRRAFALQRYQEARAQYGSRYTEYLRYLGVRSSDARLQRPEYLGGGKQTISFSEVLQSGPGATSVVGEMKGHGIAAMRSRRYRRFFEEHGLVLSLMSVRPRTMYTQALHKMWTRYSKEDYFQKELERIGQQEVKRSEIYFDPASVSETWAYQDRYAEYRHLPSMVSGDFRDTLNFWHLARIFSSAPTLNGTFVTCDPSKRINAVQTEDVLWCMVNHNIQARRMVSHSTIGRIF